MTDEARLHRERWQLIEQIYRQALALDGVARSAVINDACGEDVAMRQEVESLLACEPAAAGFMETPALDVAADILAREPEADLVGRRIGPYVIEGWLGSGGMGDVYRARDGNLHRDVALKVLPGPFALDPERLARFRREARVLASLNHSNIAAIYGFEESTPPADSGQAAVHALALELVDGLTLADRLARGAIPLDETLAIAQQIADALEAAHEQGIIHRDLKPANIKLRPDAMVKVLDFGLAKALEPAAMIGGDVTASPTITSPSMTHAGVILGTAAYMSPEQVRGRPADKRSDVWAFGAVLFEMLSGQRAFKGDETADTLAAVLRADPAWSALQPDTPQSLRRLLHRCLQKDPKHRLQHIGDARLELADVGQNESQALPIPSSPAKAGHYGGRRGWALVAAAAAGAGVVGLTAWMLAPQPMTGSVKRFSIQVPAGGSGIALSPDGSLLVYVAGGTGLVMRQLDDLNTEPVRGGEGGTAPFFSPDGAWIGFFADGKLKKVPAGGGPAVTISDAPPNARAAWGDDGTIVVARPYLYKVASTGGALELILGEGDGQFYNPEFLPGSRVVLVQARRPPEAGHVEAVELQTRTRHPLFDGSMPRLAANGNVLFAREGRIWATRFDAGRLAVVGTPVPVVESVGQGLDLGETIFATSTDGSLAYFAGESTSALVWLDRTGVSTAAIAEPLWLRNPRLSPDGRRVAASFVPTSQPDLWILELERGSRLRLTTGGYNRGSVWSPDGTQIAFFSAPTTPQQGLDQDLYLIPSAGGEPTRLLERPGAQWAASWSPDGRFLVFEDGPGFSRDLWLLPFGEQPRPLVVTRFNERGAVFSPDGRWLAFVTDESGRAEVYVQPFPGPGQKVPVSTNGGLQPVWSRNGRELFYREGDSLMTVPVRLDPFRPAAPEKLFDLPRGIYNFDQYAADYDVAADGRILAVRQDARSEIHVVLNWTEELRRALGR